MNAVAPAPGQGSKRQPVDLVEAGSRKRNPPPAGKDDLMRERPVRSIVPRSSVAGRSLVFVVAIMAFLAATTLGVVVLVGERANAWSGDLGGEITVQVSPVALQPGDENGADEAMEAALARVVAVLEETPGVAGADVQSRADAAALLEPWLGTGFDAAVLPLPRMVRVRLERTLTPDLVTLALRLEEAVPEAVLDDHRVWMVRLTRMAGATVLVGAGILALMLAATVLIVVFATRAAMAGNRDVIEVLHFVGADRGYIASQFQNHFLLLGLRGAVVGGALGLAALVGAGWWTERADPAVRDQVAALTGSLSVGAPTVIGLCILVMVLAILTALTSRMTVLRTLADLD